MNIEAPPSVYPRKKYCDITGLKVSNNYYYNLNIKSILIYKFY